MRIVQGDEVERRRGLEHRGGTFFSRTLLQGVPGSPDNFKVSLSENGTDHKGPRHRHNFDQFRFMIDGESDFSRDGKLTSGMLGYFPEGVYYGPQTNVTATRLIVLQFGGASGAGYLLPSEVRSGTEALKAFGEFRDGIFHRHADAPGRRNVDAYQAIWEHVRQREMVYPPPRYQTPILMRTDSFDWTPAAEGVGEKLFGVFTERRAQASMLKLEDEARHEIAGRGLWIVLDGAGSVGPDPLRACTAIFLDRDERTQVAASGTLLLLHFGLPEIPGAQALERPRAEAAE
ncbi:MAG: hypothetical protein JWN93_13 [Hyphomicrobiales bacterium]|nr:hypothetical protein [Hyphomicrobiales bacterium]